MTEPLFFKITPDVPPSYYVKLCDFINSQYLIAHKERFTDIVRETTSSSEIISYTINDLHGEHLVHVEIKSGNPFELSVTPLNPTITHSLIEEAKQDIVISMRIFSEKTRNASVYFAWREGQEILPEAYKKPQKSLNRMFLETQILFFLVFIIFGMAIFLTIAGIAPQWFWIAPLFLIIIQFVFVLFSSRFIERTADWHITEANPTIHLLEYYLPFDEKNDFKQCYPRETLLAIKAEIYKEVIAKNGEVDTEAAQQIFQKHGVPCDQANLRAKKVDVWALVKSIADKFHFPMPKIVVSNTMMPNAAASGPSVKRGIVLLTTGLMVQLQENEIRSVLGHEFGHLKGRDPLILYGLVSLEFLFRFYVLLPLAPLIFSSFLFFVYFWGIMVVIFFIAKFFEARADLVSAMVVGNPEVLAGSLEKIGFQRLLYERTSSYRVQEWLGLDPHPPIYFRVARLQQLTGERIPHPLVRSIEDVTRGFVATLRS